MALKFSDSFSSQGQGELLQFTYGWHNF